jgi:glycosyltransferase involved in cell wall biosynthesis
MKIAIIFSKHSEALFNKNSNRVYGGGELQMYNTAKEFSKHVKTFSFVQDFDDINFDEVDEFNIVKTFKNNDHIFLKFLKMHRAIFKVKPNFIIQRGLTPFSLFLSLYCKLCKIKFILMFGHDVEADGIYQSSLKKCKTFSLLIKNSNKIIVQNNYQRNKILSLNKNVHIIKKGLYLDKVKQNNEKKYDGIWIGRSEPWKRPNIFLDLVRKNPSSKFAMVFTEAKHNKNYYISIKQGAKALDNLHYFENINNKKLLDLMSSCKLLIFTSEKEGDWPMVVLEAASLNLPIITYSLNYDDLIDNYKGGLFCSNNPNVLDENFNKLVLDQNKLEIMGDNARKYIESYHDININIKKFLKILK